MTTPTQPQAHTSIEDYLEGEQGGDIKHEYLAGQVVAMGGASDKHDFIAAPCMQHCCQGHVANTASCSLPT